MESSFLRNIIGHAKIKSLLFRLLEQNRLPHALLFYGPEGVGKEGMALELGRFLLCQKENPPCEICPSCRQAKSLQHPDLFFLFPIRKPKKDYSGGEWESALNDSELENYLEQIKAKSADLYHRMEYPGASDILIGQVRHLIQQSSLTPFYNGNRFALISPAEKMNKESQNSLLKLLEEAPANFYICLVTSNPEQILPTIASRCQEFYFPPLSEGDIIHGLMEFYNCSQEKAQFATDRADGSFVKAVEIFKQGDPTREIAFDNFLRKQVVMKDLNNLIQQMHNSKEWNRREMRDILLNVDHWLRDVMMMDCGLKPKYFADKKENLDKFQSDIKYSNLLELRKDLWQSVDLIEKNVYIDLIYINLVQAFQKALIWTKRK